MSKKETRELEKLSAAIAPIRAIVTLPYIPRPSEEELAADPAIGLKRNAEQWATATEQILSLASAALTPLGYSGPMKSSGSVYRFASPTDEIIIDIRRTDGAMNTYQGSVKSRRLDRADADNRAAISRSLNRTLNG